MAESAAESGYPTSTAGVFSRHTGLLKPVPAGLFGEVGVAWSAEYWESYFSDDASLDHREVTEDHLMLAAGVGIVGRIHSNLEIIAEGWLRYRFTGGGSPGYYDPNTGIYHPIFLPPGFEPAEGETGQIIGLRIGLTYLY